MNLGKGAWVVALGAALVVGQRGVALGQLAAECGGDVQRFCRQVPMGGGRVLRCLQDHKDQLSAPCKRALGGDTTSAPPPAKPAPSAGASDASSACRGDVVKYCRSSVGDKPAIAACLKAHAAQLSDGCKTAMIAGAP